MATPRYTQKPFTNQLDIMLRKILPFLMRQESAKPFLKPVDFIAYNLPDYPKIIKNPIDLSTIKERLNRKFYSTFINCLQDFNIMIENCYVYNSPDDPIVLMGMRLHRYLSSKLTLMPHKELKIVKYSQHKEILRNYAILKHDYKAKNIKKPVIVKDKRRFSEAQSIIKNVAVDDKMPSSNSIMGESDFEKCATLLNELMSPKYRAINYLFVKPVNSKSLKLIDYHEFVECSIDLSTIKADFDAKLYENRSAFVDDIYSMLDNCRRYNGVDTDIGAICRQFQAGFEELYLSIFKEKCRESTDDQAMYLLMKIKRKHKEIEEMIRLNTDKISVARQRIDMIVNLFENNKVQLREEKKRKMLKKFAHIDTSPKVKRKSEKKLKATLKKNSLKSKSDIY